MSGGCAGLSLDWARQRTCARERWGRENPQRTAPGEALVSRQWTRVQFPPPPPSCPHPRTSCQEGPAQAPGPSSSPDGCRPAAHPVRPCEDGAMLRDDTPHEERIGPRDLTAWPTPPGRALARAALAAGRGAARLGAWGAANLVLVLTALVGGVVVTALVAAVAQVYESVVEA